MQIYIFLGVDEIQFTLNLIRRKKMLVSLVNWDQVGFPVFNWSRIKKHVGKDIYHQYLSVFISKRVFPSRR